MNEDSLQKQLRAARYAAVASVLITLLISLRLWLPDESFPLVPAIDGLGVLPALWSKIALILLFVSLLPFAYRPGWFLFSVVALLFCALVQTDINRLQPTYYIFLLILFCHAGKEHKAVLLILLFAGIYFWSGAHKYNAYFLEKWLGGLDKRIPFVPRALRIGFTYAVPFIEAGSGLLLLCAKTRRFACALLVLMHFIIIGTLLKETGGYNVIPLNLLMIATLLLVIYPSRARIAIRPDFQRALVLASAWLLPVLNLFGWYDHFLSFSIMSGKPTYGAVYFNDKSLIEKLPPQARPFLHTRDGKNYILLAEWAGLTKKIMVYPETRVYRKLESHLNGNRSNEAKSPTSLIEYRP